VRWVSHVYSYISIGLSSDENLLKNSYSQQPQNFLASAEFPHGGKHHDKIWNSNLPPDEASSNPHFILDCCRSTSSAILTPQYIVIAAQFFAKFSSFQHVK
jgi:hypothetical protein